MSLFDRLQNRQQGPNQQEQMAQLRKDPVGTLRQAGFNVPADLAGNPQAMVQHLLRTGQITGPMQQRIMPMLSRLMGR